MIEPILIAGAAYFAGVSTVLVLQHLRDVEREPIAPELMPVDVKDDPPTPRVELGQRSPFAPKPKRPMIKATRLVHWPRNSAPDAATEGINKRPQTVPPQERSAPDSPPVASNPIREMLPSINWGTK